MDVDTRLALLEQERAQIERRFDDLNVRLDHQDAKLDVIRQESRDQFVKVLLWLLVTLGTVMGGLILYAVQVAGR